MATINFNLYQRKKDPTLACPLRLIISHKSRRSYINTSITLLPSQWDQETRMVVGHPNRIKLNILLEKFLSDAQLELLSLIQSGELSRLSSLELKNKIAAVIAPGSVVNKKSLFINRLLRFADLKTPSTKGVYMQTYARIKAFCPETFEKLTFEAINKEWLTRFDAFLAKTSPSKNARNIHMRNIRAVFNDAIDDEITTSYPFRRFKIKPVVTPKRSLSIERLRELFNYDCEPYQKTHIEIFKLIFFLCGINLIDLCRLKTINDGRIEYNRAKTHKLYSIKVEPEAMELIEKHRGKDWLIDIFDRYKSCADYGKRCNRALQAIGDMHREGQGGKKIIKPAFPEISTYWARHTWATIAAELDIPDATISLALGHSDCNSTTEIYIRRNYRKIDDANRRVLDWVLYDNKRPYGSDH